MWPFRSQTLRLAEESRAAGLRGSWVEHSTRCWKVLSVGDLVEQILVHEEKFYQLLGSE
jgi:hypothetical protein